MPFHFSIFFSSREWFKMFALLTWRYYLLNDVLYLWPPQIGWKISFTYLVLVRNPFMTNNSVDHWIEMPPHIITESPPKQLCWSTQQSLKAYYFCLQTLRLSSLKSSQNFNSSEKKMDFKWRFANLPDRLQTLIPLLCGMQSTLGVWLAILFSSCLHEVYFCKLELLTPCVLQKSLFKGTAELNRFRFVCTTSWWFYLAVARRGLPLQGLSWIDPVSWNLCQNRPMPLCDLFINLPTASCDIQLYTISLAPLASCTLWSRLWGNTCNKYVFKR